MATSPNDQPTRAEIAEVLLMANRDTMRLPRIIGTAAYPTDWDEAHEFLGDLLTDWEHATQ